MFCFSALKIPESFICNIFYYTHLIALFLACSNLLVLDIRYAPERLNWEGKNGNETSLPHY